MDPLLLILVGVAIGIFLIYYLFRDRIEGRPVVIALLVAATIWMVYESVAASRGHRVYRIILALIWTSTAWQHWKAYREGTWTLNGRDDHPAT